VALGAAQEMGRAPPTAVDAGAPPARGKEMMTTPVAAQKAAGAAPTAAETGAPPRDDDEEMATSVAAQEVAEASPTAAEVGAPPRRDEETMTATMAAQNVGRVPQQRWKLGRPLDEMRRHWRPSWPPRRQAGRPHGGGGWGAPWTRREDDGSPHGRPNTVITTGRWAKTYRAARQDGSTSGCPVGPGRS
jgi:hypothetical protein